MGKLTNVEHLKKHQYKTPSKLNARINLHRQFSTNTYDWFLWVFDHFKLPPSGQILELGCGPGDLWVENAHRISAGWDIILSDMSEGMVKRSQKNVTHLKHPFKFALIEAQDIPFPPESFTAIIANHMLFHVPDQEKALREMRRTLKTGGRVYLSTVSENHMSELPALVTKFDPTVSNHHKTETVNFTLENGESLLRQWFEKVSCYKQKNDLRVTKVKPLVEYVLSSVKLGIDESSRKAFSVFISQEMERQKGEIFIKKRNGIFEVIKRE